MSLIVSYNLSSPSLCGVCWRVESLVETGVEWVWCLRVGGNCVYTCSIILLTVQFNLRL